MEEKVMNIEEVTEIATNSKNGIIVAVGIGVTALAGYLAYRKVVRPRIMERRAGAKVVDIKDLFGETESPDSVSEDE